MGTRYVISFVLFLVLTLPLFSQENGFTREDRERMIRMEERLDAQNQRINDLQVDFHQRINDLRHEMNQRFESQQTQINDIKSLLYVMLTIYVGGMLALVGFVLWDRRSYIKPVKQDMTALFRVLREYAQKHPDLEKILRTHGFL